MDTYSMFKGHFVPGVVTGKPINIGGSKGREEATGRGVTIITLKTLEHLGMPVEGTKVAVQGFGNVGSNAAKLLQREGCRIVAVSDAQGGTCNDNGLDIPELLKYRSEHESVKNFPGGKPITNEELLTCKCDVLVPAAMENQITEKIAKNVKARIIVEGANGPTTTEADAILVKKGIMVVPDILANAGWVTVSYFEWVQGLQAHFWSEDEVNSKLREVMVQSFCDVLNKMEEHKTDLRTAAYVLAIGRIVGAIKTRGIFP
ncbi:MAG: glutamate dehydrogenase, partial [Candidatus Micrarchaeota archaeon]|nr:glutamate dehydrogenase [Candidatus Micrarchaeota archaeon]